MFLFVFSLAHSQSENIFVLEEESLLADVLKKISDDNDIVFAYPSEVVKTINCPKSRIEYKNNEDLVAQLAEITDLEYASYSDFEFLLRLGETKLASETKSYSGRIKDKTTGSTLSFASIYTLDFQHGAFSDENGDFVLELKDDYTSIVISYVGYEDQVISLDNFKKDQDILLSVASSPIENILIEYVIPPQRLSKDGLSIILNPDQLENMTSGLYGQDILRQVQLQAGVAAYEDDSALLKIRGSNTEESKIVLDGMPLYKITHYFGIFSAVNGQFVDDVSLYKNNQPVYFESMSGGLLSMSSKIKEADNEININLLTASIALEEEIKKGFGVSIAGRSSYRNVNDAILLDLSNDRDQLQFANNNFVISNEPQFKFYDLNLSLVQKIEGGEIKLSAFKAYDELINTFDLDGTIASGNFSRNLYTNNESWENQGSALTYRQMLTKRFELNFIAHTSRYNFNSILNNTIQQNTNNKVITNENINELNDKGVNVFGQYKWGKLESLFGTSYQNYDITQLLIAEEDKVLFDFSNTLDFFNFHTSQSLTLGKLTIGAGLRYSPIAWNKNNTRHLFSPQVNLSFRATDNHMLKASYHRSNQVLREFEYETRLGQTLSSYILATEKNIPILRSNNFMVGYNFQSSGFSLDLETFYKSSDGALQFSAPTAGFGIDNLPAIADYRLLVGERRTYGVDLTLSYKKDNYTGGVSYTLSKSEDRYNQIFRGEYFSNQNDRRHQLKWLNNISLGKFSLTGNIIATSGRPYIALEKIENSQERLNLRSRDIINNLPYYLRIDFGADYQFHIGKNEASIGLSIFNITNRQNVKYIQYSTRVTNNNNMNAKNIILGTEGELLDRTLNLNFSLNF